jgi:predicted cation transporter
MLELCLFVILIAVLIFPITVHIIERNIEVFLFVMGIFAMTFSHFFGKEPAWSAHILKEAFHEPIPITLTVFIAGILVLLFKNYITKHVLRFEIFLGHRLFVFLLITALGLVSSVITAIMAAILLVEIISVLKYNRKYEVKLVVLGCFSIGLGAALTPLGEPLSTICIGKLKGAPYFADFFFLFKNIGSYVIPGILACGLMSAFIQTQRWDNSRGLREKESENFLDVVLSTVKVYVFIMALIFLGTGFKPLVDEYIIKLSSPALYWVNTLSAIMDNATLTAAEISPLMSLLQIKSALMGLLIAGGMLIPGNIPNIICAGRLGIRSKEWAVIGVPVGFIMMAVYFVVIQLI